MSDDFDDNAKAITEPAPPPPTKPNETDGESPTSTNTAPGSKGNKLG